MDRSEIIANNIEALRKRDMEAAFLMERALQEGEGIFWKEELAENGQRTAFIEEADGSISYFESVKDPLGVAEKRLENLEAGADVVVMGVGLGYTLEALVNAADRLGQAIIIEKEPALLARAFMHADFSSFIGREETRIVLAYNYISFDITIDREKALLISNQALTARDNEYYTVAFASLKASVFTVFPIARKDRFNVLMMCEDSLRRDRLSFYSDDTLLCPTPNISEFFKDSFAMDCYSVATWTPSVLASIFTGLMPWEHGINTEVVSQRKGKGDVRPNKYQSSVATNLANIEKFKILLSGNAWITNNFGYEHGFNIPMYKLGENGYFGQNMNRLAKIFIEMLEKGNFFFFLHYMDTHQPFLCLDDHMMDLTRIRARCKTDPRKDPQYKWDYHQELQRYNSSVMAADVHIGDLVDFLKEKNLWDNTVVALFSDHGEELRDHGRILYPRHGHSVYNELIDVPLVIHVPEALRDFFNRQMARFENRRISIVHIIPFLEAISNRREFDPSWFSSAFVGFSGCYGVKKAYYIENQRKLIWDLNHETYELFDLKEDPGEFYPMKNAEDEADRLKRALFEILPRDYVSAEEEIHVYDEKEMDEIQERLKDLGYM